MVIMVVGGGDDEDDGGGGGYWYAVIYGWVNHLLYLLLVMTEASVLLPHIRFLLGKRILSKWLWEILAQGQLLSRLYVTQVCNWSD